MSSNTKNVAVYFVTVFAVGLYALAYLGDEAGAEALRQLLRWTAWLAFFIYVWVFTARPLRQLFPSAATQVLLRNRRLLGIGFAAVMTVHLCLIVWLFAGVLGERPDVATLVAGSVAFGFIFLMLITSFDRTAAALGRRNWRRLHRTGLYWVGAIFAITLIPRVNAMPADPVYLAIGVLLLLAVAIRYAAWRRSTPSKNGGD